MLTRALVEASAKATSLASKRAFEHVDSLLIAQDGWLVRVDRDGNVVERVKELPVFPTASGTDG